MRRGHASEVEWIHSTYATSIANTGLMLDNALKLDEHVILEGAQGCLLTLTREPSRSSLLGYIPRKCVAWWHSPGHVDDVIGITKAYTPCRKRAMPTELEDDVGTHPNGWA